MGPKATKARLTSKGFEIRNQNQLMHFLWSSKKSAYQRRYTGCSKSYSSVKFAEHKIIDHRESTSDAWTTSRNIWSMDNNFEWAYCGTDIVWRYHHQREILNKYCLLTYCGETFWIRCEYMQTRIQPHTMKHILSKYYETRLHIYDTHTATYTRMHITIHQSLVHRIIFQEDIPSI